LFNELICLYDENDNLSPIGLSVITESGSDIFIKDTIIEIYIKKNDNKYITSSWNSTFTNGKYINKELNSYKKIVEVLESEESKSNNVTSKVNFIYINKILLFILNVIFLLNLY